MNDISILVVEDTPPDLAVIKKALIQGLHLAPQAILTASNPSEALRLASDVSPQLAILDIVFGPQHMNGFELSQELRMLDPEIYIIFQSRLTELKHKVMGFKQYKGDAYIGKPIDADDLALLVESILRRIRSAKAHEPRLFTYGDLTLDERTATVVRLDLQARKYEITLTPTEFRLLIALMQHREMIISKQKLFDLVWPAHEEDGVDAELAQDELNRVEKVVSQLRRKLAVDGLPSLIWNRPGYGYMLALRNGTTGPPATTKQS